MTSESTPHQQHDTPRSSPVPDRSGSQIDHLNIAIPDLTRARAFYDRSWPRSASSPSWTFPPPPPTRQ